MGNAYVPVVPTIAVTLGVARPAVVPEHGIRLVGVDLARIDERVAVRDRRGRRVALRQARLDRLPGVVVLLRAVVVDAVVEAPERKPARQVVQAEERQVREE